MQEADAACNVRCSHPATARKGVNLAGAQDPRQNDLDQAVKVDSAIIHYSDSMTAPILINFALSCC